MILIKKKRPSIKKRNYRQPSCLESALILPRRYFYEKFILVERDSVLDLIYVSAWLLAVWHICLTLRAKRMTMMRTTLVMAAIQPQEMVDMMAPLLSSREVSTTKSPHQS